MSVSDVVNRHAAQFAGLYPEPVTEELAAYLRGSLSQSVEEADTIESELYASAAQFFDTQSPDAIRAMYEDVQLEDLQQAEENGVAPTYITDFLGVAFDAALTDIDVAPVLEQELDVIYNPGDPGGRFDWKQQTVSVGWPASGTEFQNLLGVMYHELTHAEQFQDKIETGVAEYSALLTTAPFDTPEPVKPDEPEYLQYGVLMAENAGAVRTIFDLAAAEYTNAPADVREDVPAYVQQAVEHELNAVCPDTTDTDSVLADASLTDQLFTLQDEAEAQAAHMQYDTTITSEQERQQFLQDTEDSYPNGTELREMVEQLRYE